MRSRIEATQEAQAKDIDSREDLGPAQTGKQAKGIERTCREAVTRAARRLDQSS
jgi:hypothetical protein